MIGVSTREAVAFAGVNVRDLHQGRCLHGYPEPAAKEQSKGAPWLFSADDVVTAVFFGQVRCIGVTISRGSELAAMFHRELARLPKVEWLLLVRIGEGVRGRLVISDKLPRNGVVLWRINVRQMRADARQLQRQAAEAGQ